MTVSLEGYATFDTTFVPVSGNNQIVVVLHRPTAISRPVELRAHTHILSASNARYSVNGRYAGVITRNAMNAMQIRVDISSAEFAGASKRLTGMK